MAEIPPVIMLQGEAGHYVADITCVTLSNYRQDSLSVGDVSTRYVKTYTTSREFKFKTWEPEYVIPKFMKYRIYKINVTTKIEYTQSAKVMLYSIVNEVESDISRRDTNHVSKLFDNRWRYPDEVIEVGISSPVSILSRFLWVILYLVGYSTVLEALMFKEDQNVIIRKKIDVGDAFQGLYGHKCVIDTEAKTYVSYTDSPGVSTALNNIDDTGLSQHSNAQA